MVMGPSKISNAVRTGITGLYTELKVVVGALGRSVRRGFALSAAVQQITFAMNRPIDCEVLLECIQFDLCREYVVLMKRYLDPL